jgi:hypothetical protein
MAQGHLDPLLFRGVEPRVPLNLAALEMTSFAFVRLDAYFVSDH